MLSTCRWKDHRLVISLKPGCFTICLENKAATCVYSFDYAGRLWTSLEENRAIRHGLDGRAFARWRDADDNLHREWLKASQCRAIEKRARQLIVEVYSKSSSGLVDLQPPLSVSEMNRIKVIADYDDRKQEMDWEKFQRIYRPVGILPPDQYMSVVLQLTEGCSFNSCNFCGLYRDQQFRIKSLDEFYHHAVEVREYLREGITLRKSIFLGGANALVLPGEKLKAYLKITNQVFNVQALGGINAFVDGFSGEKKNPADYQIMADQGVNTIFIGLESGSNDLLKYLNKPANAEQVLETVKMAKLAGISTGVIILLGAGGQAFHEKHVRESVRVINEMNLDAGDMIYFSKLTTHPTAPDFSFERYNQNDVLSENEQEMQWQAIESQLEFDDSSGIPRMSIYDIRDFVF